jgi:S1-C subfamily serine protease
LRKRTWVFAGIGLAWIVTVAIALTWGRPKGTALDQALRVTAACLTISTDAVWPEFGSIGSGFLLTPDGLCASNHHVLAGAMDGLVTLGDGRVYSITHVEGYDEKLDLVVFRIGRWTEDGVIIRPQELPFVELARRRVAVGDRVATVSSPAGLSTTMGEGMISALRQMPAMTAIQISTPSSGGSSGGPVFGERGKVVAILRSRITTGENLTFAVPADSLRRLLKRGDNTPIADYGRATLAREANDSDPPEVSEAIERATAKLRNGEVEQARLAFTTLAEERPTCVAALMNAAACSQLMGDREESLRMLARLLPLLDETDSDRWWIELALEER